MFLTRVVVRLSLIESEPIQVSLKPVPALVPVLAKRHSAILVFSVKRSILLLVMGPILVFVRRGPLRNMVVILLLVSIFIFLVKIKLGHVSQTVFRQKVSASLLILTSQPIGVKTFLTFLFKIPRGLTLKSVKFILGRVLLRFLFRPFRFKIQSLLIKLPLPIRFVLVITLKFYFLMIGMALTRR